MSKLAWYENPKVLRTRRKQLGVTQEQFAKLTGFKQSAIAAIETGRKKLSKDVADPLWAALERIEAERRSEAPVSEQKLQRRIAALEKVVAALSGVKEAKQAKARAESLPWLRLMLPAAIQNLKAKESVMQQLMTAEPASLDDPIIKGLMESYEKENKALAEQIKDIKVFEDLAGFAAMRFTEAVQHGEPEACEMFSKWQKTGEAPTVLFDRVAEEFSVAQEDE